MLLACSEDDFSDDCGKVIVRSAVGQASVANQNNLRDSAVDSGCSKSMTPYKDQLTHLFPQQTSIKLADDSKIKSSHAGTWSLPITGKPSHSALYVPSLQEPLLSVSGLCDDGFELVFSHHGCTIYPEDSVEPQTKPLGEFERRGGLYYLQQGVHSSLASIPQPLANIPLSAWHVSLGHIVLKPLKAFIKSSGITVSVMNEVDVLQCSICVRAKMHRLQFTSRKNHWASKRGETIHSDVCSFEQVSREGFKYWMMFIDDYSKETAVFPMKCKSHVLTCFKQYKALFEKHDDTVIRRLFSDNGGEYISKEFSIFLSQEAIFHEPGPPHSPQLNGVAERANCTLCEQIRSLLINANVPKAFWADALCHVMFSLNSIPCNTPSGFDSTDNINGKPLLDPSYLHPFGCLVWYKVPEADRQKLDPKGRALMLLSYIPHGGEGGIPSLGSC